MNLKKILTIHNGVSQLKKNILSGTAYSIINILLLLISYPLYLRFLGTELYGLWATLTVILTFSQLGNLGINNAVIKFVAQEYGKKENGIITEYVSTAVIMIFLPLTVIILGLFIFRTNIALFLNLSADFTGIAIKLIPLIGLLSAFVYFTNIIKGTLSGIGRIDLSNYIYLVARIFGVLFSILLLFFSYNIWSLFYGVLLTYVLSALSFIYVLAIKYELKLFKVSAFKLKRMKDLFYFGGTLTFSTFVRMLLQPFNKIIISRYIGLSEVTFYEIAFKGAMQLRSIYEKGLQAIMPKISELHGKRKNIKKSVKSIYKKSLKFILYTGLPVFTAIFIFGEFLLNIWLGSNYNILILVTLRVFLVAVFVSLIIIPAYYIFMGLNLVTVCLKGVVIRVIFNISVILLIKIIFKEISFLSIVYTFASGLLVLTLYYLYQYYNLMIIDKNKIFQ